MSQAPHVTIPCSGDDCSNELPIRPEHRPNFEGRAWFCPACARTLTERNDS
jgi:hypothetical protein